MSIIFALIFLGALLALPIALIKPALFGQQSRKRLGLIFGGTALAAAIFAGATAPSSTSSQTNSSNKTTSSQQKQSPQPSAAVNGTSTSSTKPAQPVTPAVVNPTPQPTNPTPAPAPAQTQPKTYVNPNGNTVQSPTYYPSAPAGATAKCVDGTYSFSQHRQGTCSHHGGVAEWL